MEAELLRGMIADREERISVIERKMEDTTGKQLKTSEQLESIKEQNAQAIVAYQMTKTRLLHDREIVYERLETVQRDLAQQGASLHTYAGVLHAEVVTRAGVPDQNQVMRMQAQLCKAMHSMGILDHQFELCKTHCEKISKYQKDCLTKQTEEKTELELKLLNELMQTDTMCRQEEAALKKRLHDIKKECEAIQRRMREHGEGSDEEEEEENEDEDDEEEKAAKEELMQMLQDQREKIAALERATDQQLELIEEMESKLADLGMDETELGNIIGEKKIRLSASMTDSSDDEDVPGRPPARKVDMRRHHREPSEKEISVFDKPPQEEQDILLLAKQRFSQASTPKDAGSDEEDDGGGAKDKIVVDDVNELDLLNMVRARLTAGDSQAIRIAPDDTTDEEESNEDQSNSEDMDESYNSEQDHSEKSSNDEGPKIVETSAGSGAGKEESNSQKDESEEQDESEATTSAESDDGQPQTPSVANDDKDDPASSSPIENGQDDDNNEHVENDDVTKDDAEAIAVDEQ